MLASAHVDAEEVTVIFYFSGHGDREVVRLIRIFRDWLLNRHARSEKGTLLRLLPRGDIDLPGVSRLIVLAWAAASGSGVEAVKSLAPIRERAQKV